MTNRQTDRQTPVKAEPHQQVAQVNMSRLAAVFQDSNPHHTTVVQAVARGRQVTLNYLGTSSCKTQGPPGP